MKLKLVTKKGLLRIAVLLVLLAVVGTGLGWTMFRMPGKSFDGPLPPLTLDEESSRQRLEAHLKKLAGEIGERNCLHPAKLEAAAAYLEGELRSIGPTAGAEKGDRFDAVDQDLPGKVPCRNVCGEMPGANAELGIILVGAHYDSVMGCPGANDNGSGAVVLLEIARGLQGRVFPRTIRFVEFTNEEPPFFKTQFMGSLVHAKASKARGDRIEAMISLETLGFYTNAPGSQRYPPPLNRIYPDRGNFVGFVGNLSGRALLKESIRVFRETTSFPSEGGATFAFIQGVDWSDHWSFWEQGYPAFMVSDTAIFRYKHYHTQQDTVDKIDTESLARVTSGLIRVVAHLAGRVDK